MHILYLHQHFALPQGSTGTRSYEMARRWVAAGHQVTLICGITDQCGISASDKGITSLEVEGIQILALNTKYSNSLTFLERVWAFIKFMFLSFWVGRKVKEVDIIYATSTPLTIGIPAMLLKWFKRRPFVFEIRDQWPEIPIEMGIIKNPVLKAMLLSLEKRIYKSSAAIVGLSPGMSQGARDVLKSDAKKIITAPNSSDTQLFHPDIDGSLKRRELGWQDKFIILHFGAMGKANGLYFLIEAALRLKEKSDIQIVLVGEGREKSGLRRKIKELNLHNMTILDAFTKKEMPQVVAACDVSTVIFDKYPILEHNSANKFFDSLSAGKPILLNYSGWQRDVIEKNSAGFGCRQCDLDEYIEKLLNLYENRDQLYDMSQNTRRLAETEFSRDIIASNVLDVIQGVAEHE